MSSLVVHVFFYLMFPFPIFHIFSIFSFFDFLIFLIFSIFFILTFFHSWWDEMNTRDFLEP